MVEPQMGGWGATPERDGLDAMYATSHGDTFNCPAEIAEARYGLDVMELCLRHHEVEAAEVLHQVGARVAVPLPVSGPGRPVGWCDPRGRARVVSAWSTAGGAKCASRYAR